MPDEAQSDERKKDIWDKIASLTPLVIGLAVTGVGTYFTNAYNLQQLGQNQTENSRRMKLDEVEALDKLRTELISDKKEDREFAYSAFFTLGYGELAARIIGVKRDDAGGRTVLVQFSRSADAGVRTVAESALKELDLDRVRSLVERVEGLSEKNGEVVAGLGDKIVPADKLPPGFTLPTLEYYLNDQRWAVDYAKNLGAHQLLTFAVLMDTYAHLGQRGAEEVAAAASLRVKPPLDKSGTEPTWVGAFLEEGEKSYGSKIAAKSNHGKLLQLWEQRTAGFRKHLDAGDLALKDNSLDR